MTNCWAPTPAMRPSFTDLKTKLELLLEDSALTGTDTYLQLDSGRDYYYTETPVLEAGETPDLLTLDTPVTILSGKADLLETSRIMPCRVMTANEF